MHIIIHISCIFYLRLNHYTVPDPPVVQSVPHYFYSTSTLIRLVTSFNVAVIINYYSNVVINFRMHGQLKINVKHDDQYILVLWCMDYNNNNVLCI